MIFFSTANAISQQAVFCSESCRSEAMSSFHYYECNILATLYQLDMGRNTNLSLRMLTVSSLEALRMFLSEQAMGNERIEDTEYVMRGYNVKGVYDPTDYCTVYNLVGNKISRSRSDLFKRSVLTVFLMTLLKQGGRFFRKRSDQTNNSNEDSENVETSSINRPSNSAASSPSVESNQLDNNTTNLSSDNLKTCDDETLVCHTLMTHMMNLPCNAHGITMFTVNTSDYPSSYSKDIAANAFGVLSLVNHSCAANCYRQHHGRGVGVLRAIKFIGKGEEISDCYGEHFALSSRVERRQRLLRQYCFTCGCDACDGDWHEIDCTCEDCEQQYCLSCGGASSKCGRNCESRNSTVGSGGSSTDKVDFRLKCLNSEYCCSGIMSVATNACSLCRYQYKENDIVLALSKVKELSNEDKENRSHGNGVQVQNVMRIVHYLQQKFESAFSAVSEGTLTDVHLHTIEEYIYVFSRYCRLPNKGFYRAQEVLKHCYDRTETCTVLPKS